MNPSAPIHRCLPVALAAAAVIAALALMLAPAVSYAGSCSSSSDDDDSSSSSSSSDDSDSGWDWGSDSDSDDDDDDDDSSTSAPACVNSTLIVGRAECRRFGKWDAGWRPRLQFGIGGSMHAFSLSGMSFSGQAEHEEHIAYRVVAEDIGPQAQMVGGSFDVRIAGRVLRHGYIGVEGSIGGTGVSESQTVRQGDLSLTANSAAYLAGGLVAGVSVPVTRRTSLGAEAMVGGRAIIMTMTTQHGDCINTSTVSDGQGVAMPRITVTRWLSPWVTARASVGSDLLNEGAMSASLMLSGHLRGFDGARSR